VWLWLYRVDNVGELRGRNEHGSSSEFGTKHTLIASWIKKTGILFPTMSQLPSSV
jgi:hypothetical protein